MRPRSRPHRRSRTGRYRLNLPVLERDACAPEECTSYEVTLEVESLTVHSTCDDLDDCDLGGAWELIFQGMCGTGGGGRGVSVGICPHRAIDPRDLPSLTLRDFPADVPVLTYLEVKDRDPDPWQCIPLFFGLFGCVPFAHGTGLGGPVDGWIGSSIVFLEAEEWQAGQRRHFDPMIGSHGCPPGGASTTIVVSSRCSD